MQALLIADRPQIRELFSAILSDEESELTTEARIEQAADLGHERKWSIVVCDVILSGAGGSSGLQRPKQIWLTPAPGASAREIERASVQEEWPSLSAIAGRYIQEVLTHTGGNKQAAARILKIDRKTLDRMIKRHQIAVARPDSRRGDLRENGILPQSGVRDCAAKQQNSHQSWWLFWQRVPVSSLVVGIGFRQESFPSTAQLIA